MTWVVGLRLRRGHALVGRSYRGRRRRCPARCLAAGPQRQGVGQLPQPEDEESQDGHPEGEPSKWTSGDRLQRSRLVCRLRTGEPGDLQGDPADQQVENTTDGVANAGSDLECRLVLDLVCDTRDVASTRQRTLPPPCRFYGEVLPWAVRVSKAEVTVSPAQWPAEEVDQRCCPYPLIWIGAPGRRAALPSGASFLARWHRAFILTAETPLRASGDNKAAATSKQSGSCTRRILTFGGRWAPSPQP